MKTFQFKAFLSAFFLLVSMGMYAQSVSGTVSSEDGPLPGATVVVKGTSNGTTTDFDGNFTIAADADAVLVVSFVGFATQEVAVGSQDQIAITLATDNELDEVVLTGYGQTSKRNATGAIVSIKSEDFNGGIIASPEQLIQGKTAGVQIVNSSGEPGAGVNIRIRGTSSARSGNNPLFVVDGIPLSGGATNGAMVDVGRGTNEPKNPLNFLNPNDIERIDILKDASATAIYGSRGANGVILITTKSGQGASEKFEYSSNFSFSSAADRYDLLDRDQFLDRVVALNQSATVLPAAILAEQDYGADTDWQDEVLRTSLSQNHNLTYSNSYEDGNYRASLSVDDQQGIVQNSSLTRVSARLNATHRFLNDKLRVDGHLTYSTVDNESPLISSTVGFEGDLIGAMIMANPTWNSEPGSQYSNTNLNPNSILEYYYDEEKTTRTLINLSAQYDIADNFFIKANFGFDSSEGNRRGAFSGLLNTGSGVFGNGRAYKTQDLQDNTLFELTADYTLDINNGSIDFLAGYSYQKFEGEGYGAQGTGFSTTEETEMIDVLDMGINSSLANISGQPMSFGYDSDDSIYTVINPSPSVNNFTAPNVDMRALAYNWGKSVDEIQSFFARANAIISDKYLLNASFRMDGSSKFGPDNRYGFFPAVSGAWILSEESFIPDAFSNLKLRLGYGITGNQEIPHNLYESRERYDGIGTNDGGDQISPNNPGLGVVAYANPELKWEQTSQINLGLDFGFFNDRISASAEYYKKETDDLLLQIFSAQPAPSPYVWTNLDAIVVNEGYELSLNLAIADNQTWTWDLSANVAINDNVVNGLGATVFDTGVIRGQGLTGAFAQRIAEGQPLYSFYVREFIGYDNLGNAAYNEDRQKFLDKSPLPTHVAGLSNTFTIGNWDMNVFFTGQFGHYVYNNTANGLFTAGSLKNGRNVTYDAAFSGEAGTNAPSVSTRFLESADFIRLQNASIGYNVQLKPSSVFDSMRISASGQNLLLISDYSGLDPEVDVQNAINGVPSAGLDYSTYPRARTFTFGINATF
ncbi:MAG: SusC/RagA family TonB-linked outer membrane protein [Flavobacteriaceae bacterium]